MKKAVAFHQNYTSADLQTYPGFGDAQLIVISHGLGSTSPVVSSWTMVDGPAFIASPSMHVVDENTLLFFPPDAGPWNIGVVA